jgi:hypothetical protein
MLSGSAKKTVNILAILAVPLAIGFMHWRYFFPVAAHSDLQFQIVGESAESLAIVGICALIFFSFAEKRKKAGPTQVSDGLKVLAGAAFAALSITLDWREFFPNDRFDPSAGIAGLVGSLFMGLFFGIFAFAFQKQQGKPSKEDEKSVV